MPTRTQVLDTLATSQAQVMAYFLGLSPEALVRPCTASGVPGAAAWRAKDHFAHLAQNERGIQQLLRLTLTGATSLPGNPDSMSRDDRIAAGNLRNQAYVDTHRDDTMESLVADVMATRQETLQLLERFTDAQLAAPASVSLVAGRTAGELFVGNAHHAAAHITWVEEGLRNPPPDTAGKV
jgi:hypothetical protein